VTARNPTPEEVKYPPGRPAAISFKGLRPVPLYVIVRDESFLSIGSVLFVDLMMFQALMSLYGKMYAINLKFYKSWQGIGRL